VCYSVLRALLKSLRFALLVILTVKSVREVLISVHRVMMIKY